MPVTQDEKLLSLPLPLGNAQDGLVLGREELLDSYQGIFGRGLNRNQPKTPDLIAQARFTKLEDSLVLGLRSTPLIRREEDIGHSTLVLCVDGDTHQYGSGHDRATLKPGDIHLNPRSGDVVKAGYMAGVFFQVNHKMLQRTIKVISGDDVKIDLSRSWILRSPSKSSESARDQGLFAFFQYLDKLLAESSYLGDLLGLKEQIYRLLAFSLLQKTGSLEAISAQSSKETSRCANALDDLVDYIKANSHLNMTLTDLEELSRYSARHLQNLFREKFDCTPMQFVRRQRLSYAMQRLQTAEAEATVTSIARECGYRFTSNFTTDFTKHYGINPSAILKVSRRSIPS